MIMCTDLQRRLGDTLLDWACLRRLRQIQMSYDVIFVQYDVN